VLAGWLPLALLTWVEGTLGEFLGDFGAHARFLIAAPLFVFAESACFPRLAWILHHFTESGIVSPRDRGRFENCAASTMRILNSPLAEIGAVVCAYALVWGLTLLLHPSILPRWQMLQGSPGGWSLAGQWHVLVSLPLFVLLFLSWVWRQLLWGHLMFLVSRLPLQLIAAHPDGAGGLKFLNTALRGYWPLCFALAAAVAGGVANQLRHGTQLSDHWFVIPFVVALIIVLFTAPFAAFAPVLRRLKEDGTFQYGALGLALGRQFEAKWLKPGAGAGPDILASEDFSSATDLYQVVSNVHAVSYLPIEFAAVRELIIVALAPFIPVVLFVVSVNALLEGIAKILL